MVTVKPYFRWYDMWIGVYHDTEKHNTYIQLLPMLGIKICESRDFVCVIPLPWSHEIDVRIAGWPKKFRQNRYYRFAYIGGDFPKYWGFQLDRFSITIFKCLYGSFTKQV